MVIVLMGHENMVDLGERNLHLLQNPKDTVAAAGIHHEIFLAVADSEAGIIATGHGCIAGAEYVELFHK